MVCPDVCRQFPRRGSRRRFGGQQAQGVYKLGVDRWCVLVHSVASVAEVTTTNTHEPMPRPTNRQSRTPISISLPQGMWVETNRAAGTEGMTLSEYCRAAIREKNAAVLPSEPPQLKAA